jgi:bifunctional non-homologous end joining protein LigD
VSGKTEAWPKTTCTTTEHFAVLGFERQRHSLRLARLVDGDRGIGLERADVRQILAALDAGGAVVATIEFRGFTPAASCATRWCGDGRGDESTSGADPVDVRA